MKRKLCLLLFFCLLLTAPALRAQQKATPKSGEGISSFLLRHNRAPKKYYDDFIDKLALAKQKLTPAQRNIFEMSREEGMSNAEIAALSDISEQTVKNHLSAALKSLREELRKYNYLFVLFI